MPIEITLKNSSSEPVMIKTSGISLPIEHYKSVSRSMHRPSTLLTMLWPLAIINPLKIHILAAAILVYKHYGSMVLAVPVALGAISALTSKENASKTKAFRRKVMDPNATLTIQPHEYISKVMYIRKKHFRTRFQISFINILNGKLSSFRVNLEGKTL